MLERGSIFKAICVGGRKADIFFALSDCVSSKRIVKNILIDVSRQDYNKVSYSALESILDGYFFSSKYESGMVILPNNVNVTIFCNYEPDYNAMSMDRWNVINLGTSVSSTSSQLDMAR